MRALLETTLSGMRGAPIELVQVSDIDSALDFLHAGTADVCLAGGFPGEGHSGLDFILRAGAASCSTPVVFLSEDQCRESVAEAMQAGAADFLAADELSPSLLERSFRYVIDRRHLQEEIGMLLSAAGEAAAAKTEFMSNISHEVRTPLNAVIGMIDLILDDGLGGKQRENLMLARSAATSLLKMMVNLIECSSGGAGNLSIDNRYFDLRQLLDNAAVPVRIATNRKGVGFSVRIAPDVPFQLYGDPERLSQIVTHLLGNAVKFTESGAISLEVTAESVKDTEIALRYTISDTGIGIPRRRLAEIFENFTQVDGSSSRRYGGIGVGLGIVRSLVTLLGGKIWVESDPGKGTTFHFTTRFGLPHPKPGRGAAVEVTGPAAVASRPSPAAGRILVADDSALNRIVLEEALKKGGFHVTAVEDGKQVLEALETETYDLLLLDLQMPVMDGYETATAIRAREGDAGFRMPIVALTGSEYRQDRERCMRAGMDAYITKPFCDKDLLDTVSRYTSRAGGPAALERLRKHLDMDPVLESLSGNIDLFLELVAYFIREAPLLIQEAKKALTEGDEHCTDQTIHKLKGMAATIGASAIADEAFRVQLAVRRGDTGFALTSLEGVRLLLDTMRPDAQASTGGKETITSKGA